MHLPRSTLRCCYPRRDIPCRHRSSYRRRCRSGRPVPSCPDTRTRPCARERRRYRRPTTLQPHHRHRPRPIRSSLRRSIPNRSHTKEAPVPRAPRAPPTARYEKTEACVPKGRAWSPPSHKEITRFPHTGRGHPDDGRRHECVTEGRDAPWSLVGITRVRREDLDAPAWSAHEHAFIPTRISYEPLVSLAGAVTACRLLARGRGSRAHGPARCRHGLLDARQWP
jgi:hypothetical protein